MSDELQNELDALSETDDLVVAPDVAPVEEPAAPEAEVVELPVEEPAAEVPVAEAPTPEAEVVEPDELTFYRQRTEALEKEIERLAGKTSEPKTETKPDSPAQGSAISFVSAEEFEKVFESPEALNETLNKVFQHSAQAVALSMPRMVQSMVQHQLSLHLAEQEFYKSNDDLIPHRQYVGVVANELAAQHADWDMGTLLMNTAQEVRNRLGKSRIAAPRPQPAPAFVSGGSSRPPAKAVSLNSLQAELDELQ